MFTTALGVGLFLSAAQLWSGTQTELRYTIVHALHEVQGISTQAQIRMALDGTEIKIQARAPVASFDSQNANRDSHMLEVMQANQHPWVSLRGVLPATVLPSTGGVYSGSVDVELEIRGVKKKVPVQIQVKRVSEDQLEGTLALTASLDAHSVERPSLMFVKVEDGLKVVATYTLRLQP